MCTEWKDVLPFIAVLYLRVFLFLLADTMAPLKAFVHREWERACIESERELLYVSRNISASAIYTSDDEMQRAQQESIATR